MTPDLVCGEPSHHQVVSKVLADQDKRSWCSSQLTLTVVWSNNVPGACGLEISDAQSEQD